MKRLVLCLVLGIASSTAFAADEIKLPPPMKSGGATVLEAIDMRASAPGSAFPRGELEDTDLSTILWAATGLNRDGNKWTVPMAMSHPPYCDIYVLRKDGAFLFDWSNQSLRRVSDENLNRTVPIQAFAQHAPVNLVVVANGEKLEQASEQFGDEFGLVLAGAMSQQVYLAAEAVGVGVRLVYSIKRDVAAKSLGLGPKDTALFGIVLGKR